jgi:pimeloyl-ACP methyl ester carboxylesterase
VRGLLLAGARPDADSDERRAGRADTIELIRTDGPDELWESMAPKLFTNAAGADESLLFRDPDGLVGAVEAIRDREDSTAIVRSLERPVQFVVGESDPFVSADELRGFDVREVAGAGHLVNVERPDEFNEILTEFLARV